MRGGATSCAWGHTEQWVRCVHSSVRIKRLSSSLRARACHRHACLPPYGRPVSPCPPPSSAPSASAPSTSAPSPLLGTPCGRCPLFLARSRRRFPASDTNWDDGGMAPLACARLGGAFRSWGWVYGARGEGLGLRCKSVYCSAGVALRVFWVWGLGFRC